MARAARGAPGRIVTSRLVSLPLGSVQGAACDTVPEVTKFLGIPYAEPMLAGKRFLRPSVYNQSYPSPALDATSTPAPCGSICGHMGNRILTLSSEDCLLLNVWVPPAAIPHKSKLPVRVYIHGGAVTECSASDPNIEGCNFVRKTGIIQVNIQFRAGVFGFLAHRETFVESGTTGNWGLLDQQLALKWIQDHIPYFGGDPSRVMINGNSAGAQKVDYHMVLPGSAGLFSAAIAQSPPCSHFITLDQAYNISDNFIIEAGCSQPLEPAAEVACLRSLPWDTLMNLSRTLGEARPREILMCDQEDWKPYFHHVVDREVVPLQLTEALLSGQYNQVPYMAGVTTADGREFIELLYILNGLEVTSQSLNDLIEEVYPGSDAAPILEMYPEEKYTDLFQPQRARMTDLWTDIFFACPVYNRLNAMKKTTKAPLFLYQSGAIPSCPPGDAYYGPTHASELMYTGGITSNIFPPNGTCDFPADEVKLTHLVTSAWASLASNQEPTWLDGEAWPKWDPLSEMGVFLDHPDARNQAIEFRSRCKTLGLAKEQSLVAAS